MISRWHLEEILVTLWWNLVASNITLCDNTTIGWHHVDTLRKPWWHHGDIMVTPWGHLEVTLVTTWWHCSNTIVKNCGETWWRFEGTLVKSWWYLKDTLATTWWHLGHTSRRPWWQPKRHCSDPIVNTVMTPKWHGDIYWNMLVGCDTYLTLADSPCSNIPR